MEKLEYKQVATSFEVKKEGGNLYIEGYAAKFGNVDSYNDIIQQGAFALFLTSEDAKRVRLCYQHDFDNVIGVIESMFEDEQGLRFRAKISNTTLGKDVATLLEDGAINEFSIGYKTVKSSMDEQQNIRTLQEVYLYEISPVTRAANEKATLQASERKEENNNIKKDSEMEEDLKKLQAELAEAKEARKIAENALAEAGKVKDLEEKTEGYKADIENLDASIKQMSAQIEKLSKSTEGKSFEKVLAETFNSDEFKNGLKEVIEGKRVSYKTEVKSYTGLDSADLTGTVNLTMPNTQVEADAQKKLVLLGSVPTYTVPQDKAIIMWPEGAFTDQTAYVAEGTASSTASSATLEEKTRAIAKVAAFLPFSRESSTDMSYFLNWAKNEAILAIRNKVDTEMLSGLGADTDSSTQKKIYGLIGQGSTAFNATTAGVNGAIAGAQIFDLLNAIDAQISLGTNDAYQANLILMHPSDFAKYRSLKDNNGALLFQNNGGVYSYMGKTVKQTAKLSAGQMIVMDTAALQMYEKLGFEVEIERVASTDSYVMYLRWRGQFVVPSNKKKAVIYVASISSAIAAITGADNKLSMGVVTVSGLTAESAQAASAKLSWASSGEGVKYKYSTDNVNWGDAITNAYVEFDDLTPNTDYTYYIKAVKAGMIDSDSQVVSFKTAAYTAQ
jgi:HK97 family phage prohead protease